MLLHPAWPDARTSAKPAHGVREVVVTAVLGHELLEEARVAAG
jgi:hypothetical protein